MDEAAFRQVLSRGIERPCTFEKALLTRCVACNLSNRIQIAEREMVECKDSTSLSRCIVLHDHLRHDFAFSLGKVYVEEMLSHVQELRVQCGGLIGLQYVLSSQAEVTDVDSLLDGIVEKWGDFQNIPYSEVVHAAGVLYKGRRSR